MDLAKYPRGHAHARRFDDPPAPHADPEHHPPGTAGGPAAVAVPAHEWVGWRVTDELGRTIGRVEHVLDDDQWLVVGDRRSRRRLIPAEDAIAGNDSVYVPYSQELVESGPELSEAYDGDPAATAAAREHYARRT